MTQDIKDTIKNSVSAALATTGPSGLNVVPISVFEVRGEEVHLYDFETNAMLGRFELSFRLFQNMDKLEAQADGRVSFLFLPGDQEILLTSGNRVILWKLDL